MLLSLSHSTLHLFIFLSYFLFFNLSSNIFQFTLHIASGQKTTRNVASNISFNYCFLCVTPRVKIFNDSLVLSQGSKLSNVKTVHDFFHTIYLINCLHTTIIYYSYQCPFLSNESTIQFLVFIYLICHSH